MLLSNQHLCMDCRAKWLVFLYTVFFNHCLLHVICRSVNYRTIKLFFIGNGERGKTTLLRRLRALPNEAIKNPERTTGIDIEEWSYPEPRRMTLGRSSHSSKNPVQFLAWDFAGQVYIYMYTDAYMYNYNKGVHTQWVHRMNNNIMVESYISVYVLLVPWL